MYLRIHAQPGAKNEEIIKESEDVWRIRVREPAEQNRANERIRMLIAREYGVPLPSVRILTGHRSTSKLIGVDITAP